MQEVSSLSQFQILIIVVGLPLIFTILFSIISCIFCCCSSRNKSKKYYDNKLVIETKIINLLQQNNQYISNSQDIYQQLINNRNIQNNPKTQKLISKYQDNENSQYKKKASKHNKSQKVFYICYLITLFILLVCYITLLGFYIATSSGKSIEKSLNNIETGIKKVSTYSQPLTNKVDKFIGQYYMNDSNYDLITKSIQGQLSTNEFVETINNLCKRLNNVETLDSILKELNKFYFNTEDKNSSLVTVVRNIPYYSKCTEQYIYSTNGNQNDCEKADQTDAYKSGQQLLDIFYTCSQILNKLINNVNDISKNQFPEKIQQDINDTNANNITIEGISDQQYKNISLNIIIEAYEQDNPFKYIVNNILENVLNNQEYKNLLIDTTNDEDVPTLSQLLNMNLQSTSEILKLLFNNNQDFPNFDTGFDVNYTDPDNPSTKYYYKGKQTFDLKGKLIGYYTQYKEIINPDSENHQNIQQINNTLNNYDLNQYVINKQSLYDQFIDSEYNEYIGKWLKYIQILLPIIVILFLILPTTICLIYEYKNNSKCIKCIYCWMPVQTIIFFVFYLLFYLIGLLNSGIIQPTAKMLSTDIYNTTNQILNATLSNEQLYNNLEQKYQYLNNYQLQIHLPESEYYQFQDSNKNTTNTLTINLINKTISSIFDSFNYIINLQYNKTDSEINEKLNEYPYKLLPDLFESFSQGSMKDLLLNYITQNSKFNISLQGSYNEQDFNQDSQNVYLIDSIHVGGIPITKFLTNQLLNLFLQNTIKDSNIFTKILEVNKNADINESTKNFLNYLGINQELFNKLGDNLNIDICKYISIIYDAEQELKKLIYPLTKQDIKQINIPFNIQEGIKNIDTDKDTSENLLQFQDILSNVPTNFSQNGAITLLEQSALNFILLQLIKNNRFTNGIIQYDKGDGNIIDLSFKDIISDMYYLKDNKIKSNYEKLVYNSEVKQNIDDDLIKNIYFANDDEVYNNYGCPKDLQKLNDQQLDQYIQTYINTVNNNETIKQNIINIGKSFYDRSIKENEIDIYDTFAMYGFCKAVRSLDEQILQKNYLSHDNSFIQFQQDLYGLNSLGDNLIQLLEDIIDLLKQVYQDIFGNYKQCEIDNETIIEIQKNDSSLINQGLDLCFNILSGLLQGIQQSFYPDNVIKPSLVYALKHSQLFNEISDMIEDIITYLLDITVGSSSLLNKKMLEITINTTAESVNQLVNPLEVMAVIHYILLILILLLPWLLFFSVEYSYKRQYEAKLQSLIKQQQDKIQNCDKEMIDYAIQPVNNSKYSSNSNKNIIDLQVAVNPQSTIHINQQYLSPVKQQSKSHRRHKHRHHTNSIYTNTEIQNSQNEYQLDSIIQNNDY